MAEHCIVTVNGMHNMIHGWILYNYTVHWMLHHAFGRGGTTLSVK